MLKYIIIGLRVIKNQRQFNGNSKTAIWTNYYEDMVYHVIKSKEIRQKGMEWNWFSFYPIKKCGSDEKQKEMRNIKQWLNTYKMSFQKFFLPPAAIARQSLKPCSHFLHDEVLLIPNSSVHHELLHSSLGVINRSCQAFKQLGLDKTVALALLQC